MSIEALRAEFERIIADEGWPIERHTHGQKPYINAIAHAMWQGFQAGHAAAQPKWIKPQDALPQRYAEVWVLLSNGSIVKGSLLSADIGWSLDPEKDEDVDADIAYWASAAPPSPPTQQERQG